MRTSIITEIRDANQDVSSALAAVSNAINQRAVNDGRAEPSLVVVETGLRKCAVQLAAIHDTERF